LIAIGGLVVGISTVCIGLAVLLAVLGRRVGRIRRVTGVAVGAAAADLRADDAAQHSAERRSVAAVAAGGDVRTEDAADNASQNDASGLVAAALVAASVP